MRPHVFALLTAGLCLAATAHAGQTKPLLDADAIKALVLPDVEIKSVAHTEGGKAGVAGAGYYDVDGVIGGTIGFELLLPLEWNGRFTMGGGGGFVGSVQNMMRGSANQGYATVGTDTGHTGTDGSWALNDLLAQVNFGHLAVHRTTEVAKAIIHHTYGSGPEFSYFLGCSRGGGQAMMEAQRYPQDFDGIVSGAPAFDWTGIAALFVQMAQAFYPDPNKLDTTVLPKEDVERLYAEILKQCDEKDGLKDGIIADPRDLTFDLSKVPGLNDAQRKAIQVVYDGAKNADGSIYPGFPLGCEPGGGGWFSWITGPGPLNPMNGNSPSASFMFGTHVLKYFVFNDPELNYATYDFGNWDKDSALTASNLSATNPDLTTFKDRGGKLILWHGWADAALPAGATIDYYEKVRRQHADADDFTRLYLLSGCMHCGGGSGPSGVDWLEQIVGWVEGAKAPEVIIATGKTADGASLSRPLFPYPQEAMYDGEGDPNDAANFVVRKP